LHDSVNQILSSVKFRMESVEDRIQLKDKALRAVVANAKLSLENAIHEVRRISQNLRPSELDDLGVVSAIRSMCDEFKAATKIEVELKISRFPKNLSPEVEVTVYRIVQEALSNVAKHSEATRLTIRCAKEHSHLALQIVDNGRGTESSDLGERSAGRLGMGLLNMKERAASVGGSVSIHSSLKKGMEINVQLPYGDHAVKEITQ